MAEELGISKAEIRLTNANFKGEITGQGLHFKSCGLKESLETVIRKSDFHAKSKAAKSGRYKRGIGIASMLHVGGGAKIYRSDGCGTTVKIDAFGYLTIISGSTEIGQGSETVLAMIAQEELGIDPDKIQVINSDTDIKPWDVGVHASRTSFVAGNSLLGAINKLKEKLGASASQLLGAGPEELVYEKGEISSSKTGKAVKLDKVVRDLHFKPPHELCVETYFYEPPSEFQDKGFKGDVSGNYAFASQAIEVEVDTYTGKVNILNVYVAQDVGRVLNPLGLEGQIEGGLATGIGYALTEEMKFKDGYLLNPNFHNYKILTSVDMPKVHFYPVETYDPAGPYGAKGVGEAPLIPSPPAIANAVGNALGIEFNALPLSPETVFRAIKSRKCLK